MQTASSPLVIIRLLFAAVLAAAAAAVKAEELPDIVAVREKWLDPGKPTHLLGMGIIGDQLYLADATFNVVRLPAHQFAVSGEGKEVTASVDLTGGQVVFNFKKSLLETSSHPPRDASAVAAAMARLSVFFAAADGGPIFAKDSLAFFMNYDFERSENNVLVVASLDNFEEVAVHQAWLDVKRSHNWYRMFSSDSAPLVFHPTDQWRFIDFKQSAAGLMPEGELHDVRDDLALLARGVAKAGYYQSKPDRLFIFKASLEVAIFTGNSLQRTIPYKDFFLYDEGGLLFRLRHLLIAGLFLVLIVLFFLVYCRVYALYCGGGGGAKNDASGGSDEGGASQSKTKKPGKKKEEETKTATVTPTLTTATSSKRGGGSSGKGVTTTTTKTPITLGKTSAPSSSSGKGTAPKAAPAANTTAGTVSMKEKAVVVMKKVAKNSK